ncbi:actin-like protein 6B [Diorhabda carinulata]|uniref:actin-like protein 6B n=1 Tax=Diorhabda sublineata TaxID=1163346 RepID=UPI0024E13A35|nr:actin-like protein 6B [Diorhabda sublineata]XP_057663129.1 actin-like protein 6B [Diorhabda carinulata]
MSGGMLYGGDEIGALVFDPGHHSLRVGYAQEDTPKAEIPAIVGVAPEEVKLEPEAKPDESNVSSNAPNYKYYIDTTYLHSPRPNMELHSYMKEGMIEDWDLFEKIMDYSYSKIIQSESQFHPVLFSESPWNLRQKREKLTELMFEKYKVPAFFLVKNAALAAFANGRATALVVDSGATHTTAVPVLDGYVLNNAVVKSPLGGDLLVLRARELLENMGIDLTPTPLIASKEIVREKEKPNYTKKKLTFQPTNSWITYMIKKTVQDFHQSVLQVSENSYDERSAANVPAVHYEFPSGYHQDFGSERFKIAEGLFEHAMLGAGYIAATSVGMCDVDIRPALYSSVVLTGGNTLVQGFSDRLSRDLSSRIPGSMRLKMIAANGTVERRFGAWVGGSILASIGTFQQMWVSMQEYQECGKTQIDRKCP